MAFAFFGSVPERMVHGNLKAVVETIFSGKQRLFNRRFMMLANHHVFEAVACALASGWQTRAGQFSSASRMVLPNSSSAALRASA